VVVANGGNVPIPGIYNTAPTDPRPHTLQPPASKTQQLKMPLHFVKHSQRKQQQIASNEKR
jgi:hypothetical protein